MMNDPYKLIMEQAKVIVKMDRQMQEISDAVAAFMEGITEAIKKVVDRVEELEKHYTELKEQSDGKSEPKIFTPRDW